MQDDERRELRVDMHVEWISPLDRLGARLPEKFIGDEPHDSGGHDAREEEIHKHDVQDEVNGLEETEVEKENEAEGCNWKWEKDEFLSELKLHQHLQHKLASRRTRKAGSSRANCDLVS